MWRIVSVDSREASHAGHRSPPSSLIHGEIHTAEF